MAIIDYHAQTMALSAGWWHLAHNAQNDNNDNNNNNNNWETV